MKRTTIVLPDELYESLRRDAFNQRVSMAALFRSRLANRPATPSRKRRASSDPLLKVAGVIRDGRLSKDIDETLYGD